MSDLLTALGAPRTPTALQRSLGVDYSICWQLFRLAKSDASVAQARHAPSPAALKRVLAAARGAGVMAATVDAVREAAEQFGAVVERHAGDRSAFGSMVAGIAAGDAAEQIDLKHRRAVYRGLSHLWGLQIDTHSVIQIVRRSPAGEGTDQISLVVKFGVRRLRPDAPVLLGGYYPQTALHPDQPNRQSPLDPEAERLHGAPILPQFSSQPVPPLRSVPQPSGWVFHELGGNEIGLRSNADFVFGRLNDSVPPSLDAGGRRLFHSSVLMNTPAALLVSDVLVHRPSFGAVRPKLAVFRKTPGDESTDVIHNGPLLPSHEQVLCLGRATQVTSTPEIPRYADLLRFACGAAGWGLEEFDVYRVRVPFPIMYSVVRIYFHTDPPVG